MHVVPRVLKIPGGDDAVFPWEEGSLESRRLVASRLLKLMLLRSSSITTENQELFRLSIGWWRFCCYVSEVI